jgi:Response regulator containing CheY-like receiver domain and AraC-type DNA-binding domain
MNLLIVDDEKITRDGILQNINWKKIGINSVYQADDGMNGLLMAKKHKPEIILSDVRMPRMNGIEMANKIRDILPDSSIIFMSGYSDKEYLKAAIRLKAISYVEKPISPKEVAEAVAEAVVQVKTALQTQHSNELYIRNASNKLALDLTYSKQSEAFSYAEQFAKINIAINSSTMYTTLIIKSITHLSDMNAQQLNQFYLDSDNYLAVLNLKSIFTTKQDCYIILHLLSAERLGQKKLDQIGKSLSESLLSQTKLFVSIGKTVTEAEKIYDSYNSAVILLENSFFHEYNSILQYQEETPAPNINLDSMVAGFKETLDNKDMESSLQFIEELYLSLKRSHSILVSIVKNTYYKMLAAIMDTSGKLHLQLALSTENFDTLLDDVSKCSNLSDLNDLLKEKTTMFYSSLQTGYNTENSIIFLIKEYIAKNYRNEQLSVKDISEHVYLSFSYVCTVFKTETGKTLNQFITEFRIEKAKSLLSDPRYKITDIASKVGYSDSNYFGKLFKKMEGLSPSEFREKHSK